VSDPKADAERIMGIMDRMSQPMRALVHIYGFAIVYSMRQEGYTGAKELRPILETWRQRRQQELLDARNNGTDRPRLG
jgi:hypothetical protein